MPKVLIAFTMSLDGFIAGPNVSKAYPLGEGGEHLHEWLFKGSNEEPDASMGREMFNRGGATVLGKRTYDVGLPHSSETHALRRLRRGTNVFCTSHRVPKRSRRSRGGIAVLSELTNNRADEDVHEQRS